MGKVIKFAKKLKELYDSDSLTYEKLAESGKEIINSQYRQMVENPIKKKVRDIFAKRGSYALEKFDEGIVRYAIHDYINKRIEVPVIPKDSVKYGEEEVFGFQDGRKIEYLRAHKIKKMLGQDSDRIKYELGLGDRQFDIVLKDYVVIHELAEKRLMEYIGGLSKEKHAWLQAKLGQYMITSDIQDIKTIGKLAYEIDSLRKDELGLWTRNYRKAA